MTTAPKLARRLGPFDAGLIVMGGIIGSGIFRNPSVVARYVHTAGPIMLVWCIGGAIALLGAFLFAELAARRPADGGLYAYMRDAFHPVVAFMYGWTLLLVSQSGGMAAAAVTFGGYFEPLTGLHVDARLLAVIVLFILTIVNCLGVREGSNLQNAFMIVKIAAISALILVGAFAHPSATAADTVPRFSTTVDLFSAMSLAMIPVLFAYSGWQTSSFMTGELKNPAKTLPFGLLWGVVAVIVLYVLVNLVSVHVLGGDGLMRTDAPAAEVMRIALGPLGARLIALAVALSTLGFLSNQILTSPRVYHAMAQDGSFFKQVAWVHPKTRVPIVAIALQGFVALVITLSGRYDQILGYVISVDYIFFGLAAIALFAFRRRDARSGGGPIVGYRMPGHPWSTALFGIVAWAVVVDTWIKSPGNSLIGLGILLVAIPIYFLWRRSPDSPNEDGATMPAQH
ncbi:MAG: amino acid permease [Candidatus Eremiobacteraeota bacterium]|nr:amino acid permease [Candidatus Eremiobacteraeota bacterium]